VHECIHLLDWSCIRLIIDEKIDWSIELFKNYFISKLVLYSHTGTRCLFDFVVWASFMIFIGYCCLDWSVNWLGMVHFSMIIYFNWFCFFILICMGWLNL